MKKYHIIFMRVAAILLRTVLLVPLMAHAVANLQATFSPPPYSTVVLTGSISTSDVEIFDTNSPMQPANVISLRASGLSYDVLPGNLAACNASSIQQFVSQVNAWLSAGLVLHGNITSQDIGNRATLTLASVCTTRYWFVAHGLTDAVEIVNPPNPKSVCTLNSQNLNLNYSSTSLNVNGLTQSTNLYVSCTSGNAQNYQLRLTGSNVTSGRLNFGNGVTAQVSLNGTQVSANSSGISLNGLTSRNVSVSATLVGSASTSGITNANGVLVLDAL